MTFATRFNPCFGGTPFQTVRRQAWKNNSNSFQSLFWWNSLSDGAALIDQIKHRLVFQSLFWWNSLSDQSEFCGYWDFDGVSILVLVELPFRLLLMPIHDAVLMRFNPCFGGTPFQTTFARPMTMYHDPVSILVLVELPFRHHPPIRKRLRQPSFNPCFGGTPFQTRRNYNH